jgi:phosphoribosylglycinamide formyltransferase 1
MSNNNRNSLPPLRIAVLASGEGLTLQALLGAIAAGDLRAEIVLVVSNNAEAGALRRARQAGIDTLHLSAATHPDPAMLDAALTAILLASGPELVVTTGYMKRLGPQVMAAYRQRMINVHPSLLPSYGGQGMYDRYVHEAVLAAGETESGVSVHFVEGDYDSGPVIAQARVPVMSGDTIETLSERVKQRERLLLIDVLQRRAEEGRFIGFDQEENA